MARRWQVRWTLEKKFAARLARTERNGNRVLLCEPLSYMNASGEVVRSVADYFQAEPARLLVAVERDPLRRYRDAELAELGIDASTARRQFKRYCGMTFQAYHRARRMAWHSLTSGKEKP